MVHHPPASQWSLLPAHRLNDSIPSSSVPKLSAPLDCMHAHWSVVVCHLQHQIPSSGYARQSLIAERKTWLIHEEVSDPGVPGAVLICVQTLAIDSETGYCKVAGSNLL